MIDLMLDISNQVRTRSARGNFDSQPEPMHTGRENHFSRYRCSCVPDQHEPMHHSSAARFSWRFWKGEKDKRRGNGFPAFGHARPV
jgi:hypothetical protein